MNNLLFDCKGADANIHRGLGREDSQLSPAGTKLLRLCRRSHFIKAEPVFTPRAPGAESSDSLSSHRWAAHLPTQIPGQQGNLGWGDKWRPVLLPEQPPHSYCNLGLKQWTQLLQFGFPVASWLLQRQLMGRKPEGRERQGSCTLHNPSHTLGRISWFIEIAVSGLWEGWKPNCEGLRRE